MIRLAKGEVQAIGKRLGCTRQYVSRVVSSYRKGIVKRGIIAYKIIKAYKRSIELYEKELEQCKNKNY